jgi:hypothetical protein
LLLRVPANLHQRDVGNPAASNSWIPATCRPTSGPHGTCADTSSSRTILSAEETAMLDKASTPIIDDYPYGDLGVSQRDRELPAPRPRAAW